MTAMTFDAHCPIRAKSIDPETEVFMERLTTLTALQRQAVRLRAIGFTTRQAAERMFLAENTVKGHLTAAYAKLRLEGETKGKMNRLAYLLGRYDAMMEARDV